jgi:ubiquinol-cytochrome c reductase cytochrome b subunit
MRPIIDWLEHRTGIESAIKSFLYEEIPYSSGWKQVLGSVALFSFLVQAFTGVLLAFNYAPTPGDSYNSLKYIVTELTGGSIIRGLHHWGASMMIVVVVLHMTQVFLWGGYKKPREATWMMGVVLLLVTLAFGLTGYLLPWDNRAYWGTVVTTQIAASAPGAGPYLTKLLGAEGGAIGAVTFARFYALHVLMLPPLITLGMVAHVYLVRKHGVAPEPEEKAPPKKFYPEQVFKDTVAIFVAFTILVMLAVVAKVPLGRLADPTDTTYVPRPEWYFLFLFQTLKFFEGSLEIVGSVVLPTIAIGLLFLVPFLDRRPLEKLSARKWAIGVFVLAAAGWTGLTAAAIATTPKSTEVADESGPQTWQQLSAEELAGIGYFRREACNTCHPPGASGVGPDLTKTEIKRNAAWMIEHFKRPKEMVPGSSMPAIQLSDAQLNALAAFLLKLNAKNREALLSAPAFAVEGAMVYQANRCGSCHQLNGTGMKLGPPLNGLAARRSREWVEEHFRDPQKVSPGSTMPAYRFNARDMERITSWLMSVPRPVAD